MDARKLIIQKRAQENNSSHEIVVNNKYTISVPDFLEPMHLNDDASFQYGSKTLDMAFYIIDESKEEFKQCRVECKDILPDAGQTLLEDFATVAVNNMFDIDKIEIEKSG